VVPGGAGDESGGCWASARSSVQAAVDAAALSGEEVWVAAGRYPLAAPLELRNGSVVLGGFTGTESMASQRDPQTRVTVFDGQDAVQVVRMVDIVAARLDGVSVAHGSVAATNKMGGAGILISGCQYCTVATCRILHNRASLAVGATSCEGGGVLLKYSTSCQITDCLFTDNQATYGTSLSILYAAGTLVNACRFAGECHVGGRGVVRVNGSGPTYQNCVFTGNRVFWGSAIYSAQDQVFVNCTACFTWNETQNGALHVFSPLTIRNNILAFNHPEAIREMNEQADPVLANNLFHGQGVADYFDFDGTHYLTGASQINVSTVPNNASGNVDGDPLFACCPVQDNGTWTTAPAYDRDCARTKLVDDSATFIPGELKGCFLNPDNNDTWSYGTVSIVSSTTV